MISAIVLAPDTARSADVEHVREVAVRSLVWLVSAVVSGVVRDVTLAVPTGLGLSEVADQVGCAFVEADGEADRLVEAVKVSRGMRLLIIKAGFQPDGGLPDEIDSFVRRSSADAVALVLAAPATAAQRLLPDRAPIVGVLVPRGFCLRRPPSGFDGLARLVKRGVRLRTRASRIP